MKKLLKSLVLFAAAAMALTSCENEAINEGVESNDTYTMTFTAGAPESKTAVSINGDVATFTWDETGEKLYFLQYGGGKIYKQQSEEGVIDGQTATFSVTFGNQVDGVSTYTYSAIYPSTNFVNEDDDWNGVDVKIPEMQVFKAQSYDPAADLMVAKPIEADYNDTEIHKLQFTRLAAVAKMSVKNILADEVIENIEFTLAEGTKFVGDKAIVDVENGVLVDGGSKNSITLIPASELTTTGADVPVFFTCFPVEYTGAYTLTVNTDKATYSNSGNITTPLVFTAGNVITFNINAGDREEKSENEPCWYKISALSELAVGDKVALVGTTNSGSYSMTGGNGSTAPTVSKVTFNADGTLSSVAGLTTFNIGQNNTDYILYVGDATTSWLYCTNTNNGVRVGTNDAKAWTIAKHSTGSNFSFKHNGTSRYLGIYNNSNWRCYTSLTVSNFDGTAGTGDIAIYKYGVNDGQGGTEPEPEPEPTSVTISQVTTDATSYTVENATILATYNKGYLLGDTTGKIVAYTNAAPTLVVGDIVTIEGTTSTYGGLIQFGSNITIEKTGSTTVNHGEAVELNGAAMDTYVASPSIKYVTYTGTLSINGNYYNVVVDGTNVQGSLQYPTIDLSSFDGKTIIVTGYAIGTSGSSTKYLNTMVVSIEEGITLEKLATPANVEAIAVGKDVTIAWDAVANATSYYVTCGDQNTTVTLCEADFAMAKYSTEYNITVVAKAEGYSNSDAATTTVTTEADPNASDEESTVTINMTSLGDTRIDLTVGGSLTLLENILDIKYVTRSNSSNTSNYYGNGQLRLYKNDKFTFSSTKCLKSITFTCASANYGATPTVTPGTVEGTTTITWTASDSTTKSFDLTASGSQLRITSIEVTYYN